jgi:hypothetical protein
MEWLNLHTSILDSPEVIGSDPVDRGTWLMLLRYCIGQENAGKIDACREWKDRKWQQLVRVTKKEVEADSDLWKWEGADLVVAHYPAAKEAEVRTKREIARENGNRGGRPKRTQAATDTQTNVGTEEKPTSVIFAKAEGKGREGEGEGEGNNRLFIQKDEAPRRPSLDQAKAAAAQIGISPTVADEWWNAREATGWTKGQPGGSTVSIGANWQADLKTYASRMAQSKADKRPAHRQGEFPEPELRTAKLPRL